jgi:hypothetical protein
MSQMILEHQENRRFTNLARRIDEYLVSHQVAETFGTSAESLDRLPNGNMFVQRRTGTGIRIRAQIESDNPTVTLQIFFDPLRFRAWTDAIGPVELFYMDPYGIEVFYKEGEWKIAIDRDEIRPMDTSEIYEVARIEIKEVEGKRELNRVK